ncbi:MAG: type II/IV secretion system protein [Lentisphaerae bacterium]|nr:type II/IV secretion system protein [Lentisphaerota bacterium]
MPIYEMNYVATVVTDCPDNPDLVHLLEPLLDRHISLVFAFPQQIEAAIDVAYADAGELLRLLRGPGGEEAEETHGFGQLNRMAREKAVADFTRGLFLLALHHRASDIHIEPDDESVRIRYRQDGVLREVMRLDMEVLPALVNHLKILAEADIAESRKPQDGRISYALTHRALDMRFSCVPTINGPKVVLRLLGQNAFSAVPDLEELVLARSVYDDMNTILSSPNGIFFITGPTGSGKTTTLFSALKRLNSEGINIMTVEDPVEYRLPGLNQVQVNPTAGVTFAGALRAFLRQDPNVILIGEIRDLETAKIAAQAALTGHLVMATMHTNNALQAVTRLIQIGVEPFLVAPSLIGVMAQRLVRRLCDHCKERYTLTPEEAARYFEPDDGPPVEFCRPVGCERCNGTGYSGRVAIHELFLIDEGTRELIARHASILDIQRHAAERGFPTMRYDGFKKVLRGLTTPEEVDRAMIELDPGDRE